MSRFENRLGRRCYGYDRQGERYSRHSDIRPHGTDHNYRKPRRMLVAVKEGMLHPKPPTYRRLDMDDSLHKLPIEHCRTSTSRSVDDFRNSAVTLFRKTKQPYPDEINVEMDARTERPLTERAQTATAVGDSRSETQTMTRQRPFTNSFGGDFRRMNREELGRLFPAFGKEPDESSFSKRYRFQYIPPHVLPEQVGVSAAPAFSREANMKILLFCGQEFNQVSTRGGLTLNAVSGHYVSVYQYSKGKVHFVDWTGIRPIPANTYSRYRDAHPVYSENISSRSWKP